MSGPYHEETPPLTHKKFICDLCNYETLTKQGMWSHIEKKHPDHIKEAD